MDICTELLEEYIIASIDSGPDNGTIRILVDKERKKIKNLLDKEIRYDKLKKN